MVSLQQQRKQTVVTLAVWLRQQFSSVLEELRSEQYWDADLYRDVSFDDLSKERQALLVGRRVADVLEGYIRQNYTWSHMTELSYKSVVLRHVGCIRKYNHWLCPSKPKE